MYKSFFMALLICGTALFAVDASIWKSPANLESPEVQKVMQALSAAETVHGTFTQKRTVVKIKRTFESSGKFEISQKNGITWDMEKPFASKLVISDSGVVQTNADGSKTKMASADNVIFREIATSMRAVLSGNIAVLENRFDLFFLQQKKGWSVGLLPKEKTIRKAITSIVLEGDKDLKKVELVDGEGNILTYEFKRSGK